MSPRSSTASKPYTSAPPTAPSPTRTHLGTLAASSTSPTPTGPSTDCAKSTQAAPTKPRPPSPLAAGSGFQSTSPLTGSPRLSTIARSFTSRPRSRDHHSEQSASSSTSAPTPTSQTSQSRPAEPRCSWPWRCPPGGRGAAVSLEQGLAGIASREVCISSPPGRI